MDTIAAIATAMGQGGIAVLRVSGTESLQVLQKVFRKRVRKTSGLVENSESECVAVQDWQPRHAYFGVINAEDGTILDEVVATYFRGPQSFTGEDVVEIACHGGVLITRRILELLLRNGARSAEAGEFTQRAFLNGKLDLIQAEAVMDLIGAQSDKALRAAAEQMEGALGKLANELRTGLLDMLAQVEAYIDFPEEDIDPETGDALELRLRGVRNQVERLLGTASQGRMLREGVRTVIYGEPNAGKSSLLNRLLGYERAIVSAQAGTTRDTLEEVVMMRGWPVRLVDTAGVRATQDEIEAAGVERTRKQVAKADIILRVVDASLPPSGELVAIDGRELLVLNKVDLGVHTAWSNVDGVRLSCSNGEGFDLLEKALVQRVETSEGSADWMVAINARHQDCLRRALEQVQAAQVALTDGLSPEFVAEELRGAMAAVGEMAGRADTEELLGKIFSSFCIGK